MSAALDKLKSSFATSATGWGAVIDGMLDIRTIAEEKKLAAYNALIAKTNTIFVPTCRDPDCDCLIKILAEKFPAVKLVQVRVEAITPNTTEKPHG